MKKFLLIIALIVVCGYSHGQVKVLSNGNTGIGITNPVGKLHIVGGKLIMGVPPQPNPRQ